MQQESKLSGYRSPACSGDARLHLPSLQVEGFRGINNLRIGKLGRVTLLAGANGVGKTTVLDAVGIFAARARYLSLVSVLERNEEYDRAAGEQAERDSIEESPRFESLFHGRHGNLGDRFTVGCASDTSPRLTVEICSTASMPEEWIRRLGDDSENRVVRIVFGDHEDYLPVMGNDPFPRRLERYMGPRQKGKDGPDQVTVQRLGPGLTGNRDLDQWWGEIALTEKEELALQALNLAVAQPIDGVAMIPGNRLSRRVLVKLKDGERVPLRSLGDGATRLFGLAIALANCVNGFLLIDEAGNGLHHTRQHQYWQLIMRAAEEHNVQVIATTHSWDCLRGFASAAAENPDVSGVVVRLETGAEGLRAVEYSEEELATASAQGIEVR